jgi:NAD(P)-dependent dehydrogenase (short-subunit alcohol dehydrogenase family)
MRVRLLNSYTEKRIAFQGYPFLMKGFRNRITFCSNVFSFAFVKRQNKIYSWAMIGKTILITGASSGIGRASALLFAENGWQVAAVGRNEIELQTLGDKIQEKNAALKIHRADLRREDEAENVVEETIKDFGQINALINAAGIILNGTIENTTLGDWDEMMNINLRVVFSVMQKCVPHLEKTKGSIVNVSSVAGIRSFPNVLAYCVSKAAVDQLTRCSALELAPKGIRVNAVNPGVVVTNLHKRGGMADGDYEKFLENSKKTHPIGRIGTPEEVAELIYFLASEKAGWITGATYLIDGGRGQTCAR